MTQPAPKPTKEDFITEKHRQTVRKIYRLLRRVDRAYSKAHSPQGGSTMSTVQRHVIAAYHEQAIDWLDTVDQDVDKLLGTSP